MSKATSLRAVIALGHPPRHINHAKESMLRPFVPNISKSVLQNKSFRLTSPVDSPDSKRLIVLIVSHANLPVPEWCILSVSTGTDDPVKINCPSSFLWSISKRAASHSCGASCHSSIRRGVSPARSLFGDNPARAIFWFMYSGSSIYTMLLACCSAVVVLPHHLGPCINTPPTPISRRVNNWSAIRGLYSFI